MKGGSRKGAGRPKGPATFTYSIRTTREGWQWLNKQALKGQMLSVGGWARKEADKETGTTSADDAAKPDAGR